MTPVVAHTFPILFYCGGADLLFRRYFETCGCRGLLCFFFFFFTFFFYFTREFPFLPNLPYNILDWCWPLRLLLPFRQQLLCFMSLTIRLYRLPARASVGRFLDVYNVYY